MGTSVFGHVWKRSFSISARLATAQKPARVPLSHTDYSLSSEGTSSLCPVLMTHGLLGSKQNWISVGKAISRDTGRRVITFDARNHGESPHSDVMSYEAMMEDLFGLVDSLSIEKFVLLGHSMGGRTAASFALKYPERLKGVVIVDISPLNLGGDFDLMRKYLGSMISIRFHPSVPLSEARKIANSQLSSVVTAPEVRAFLLTNLFKNDGRGVAWRPNLEVLLNNLGEIKKFPEDLLSSSCQLPTLFIRGGNSEYVPESEIPKIRDLFPKAEFFTIENSGHWPQADNPQEFIKTLTKFLNQLN